MLRYFFIIGFFCTYVSGFLFLFGHLTTRPVRTTYHHHASTVCARTPLDVVFLLDSSGSEGSDNFHEQLTFVQSFVQEFDIGPSNMQVSVVTFSTNVSESFNLKKYHSKYELLRAVGRVQYTGGRTQTDEAIRFVYQHSFTAQAGDRPNVLNVMIVMTDGMSLSTSDTKHAADLAHVAGIKCFAIGIGSHGSTSELENIASDHQHVYQVSSFSVLSRIQSDLTTKICEVTGETLPFILTTKTPTTTVCARTPLDVVFLLDSSGSEGSDNFHEQLTFVQSFVQEFDIGPSNMQVSVVTFSTNVSESFNLKKYHSKYELLRAVGRVQYTGGRTHTDEAIRFVYQHSFTAQAGDRPNVPNVMIVMTDGMSLSTSDTKHAADLAHVAGITCFAIGIGSHGSTFELENIASDHQHVYQVSSFSVLSRIQSDLATKICEVTGETLPFILTTKTPTTTGSPQNSNVCKNRAMNCESYGQSVCRSYGSWAREMCSMFCGFCTACSMPPVDVIFLLDSSISEGRTNFHELLTFVQTFVRKFDIGPSNMQVGVVTFATTVVENFNLKACKSKGEVLSAIGQIQYLAGRSTQTDSAIRFVYQQGFTFLKGDRPEAPNIMIVMTHGQSRYPSSTQHAADLAHQAGIQSFAIGIGHRFSTHELQTIASSPQHVLQVSTFDALPRLQTSLSTTACEAVKSVKGITIPTTSTWRPSVSSTTYQPTTTTMMTTSTTTVSGLTCPECDQSLNCTWNRVCPPDQVCLIRQYENTPFSVHCSEREDCLFMKKYLTGAEIFCCEDSHCITTTTGTSPKI